MPLGYSPTPTGPLDRLYRSVSRLLSRHGGAQPQATQEALRGFLRAQRLAYAAVEHVAAQLRPGITEREAATLLEGYLRAHGTERYLHRPFAWFGEHSRFDGYAGYADYHPSDRALQPGDAAMAAALESAGLRVFNGYQGVELNAGQPVLTADLRGKIEAMRGGKAGDLAERVSRRASGTRGRLVYGPGRRHRRKPLRLERRVSAAS